MAAVVIVGVEEGRERGHTLALGAVGVGVGPLLFLGAVEPFDVAVGPWPVGPGPLVRDGAEGVGELA